jgi:hypothetical protein
MLPNVIKTLLRPLPEPKITIDPSEYAWLLDQDISVVAKAKAHHNPVSDIDQN